MSVGVMKDYKLKQRNLHASMHCLILEVPETASLFRFGFVLFRLKPCRFDLNSSKSAKWFYCVETVL